jgi:hypothetical protein
MAIEMADGSAARGERLNAAGAVPGRQKRCISVNRGFS